MTYEFSDELTQKIKLKELQKKQKAALRQAISDRKFLVWDGGKNQITLMAADGTGVADGFEISKADFIKLNVPGLQPGMALIGEEAHHRARNILSLSHVFEYDELVELRANADRMGVLMFMCNQDTSQFARHGVKDKSSEFKGTDRFDCYAIKEYLLNRPELTVEQLRRFKPITTEQHQERVSHLFKLRSEINRDNLIAQKLGYEDDEDNAIIAFINEHIEELYELLTPDERDGFEFKKPRSGKNKGVVSANMTRLYPVMSTLIKRDGGLRRRLDNNQVPYWKFVAKHLFGIQASHRKAGVCAAKYKYYIRLALSPFSMTLDDGEESWVEKRLSMLMKKAEEGKKGNPNPRSGRVTMHTNLHEDVRAEFRAARASADKQFRDCWRKLRAFVIANLAD